MVTDPPPLQPRPTPQELAAHWFRHEPDDATRARRIETLARRIAEACAYWQPREAGR